MMKYLVSFVLSFVVFFQAFSVSAAMATTMAIAPAKVVFEMERGESRSYDLNFSTDLKSGQKKYDLLALDYVFDEVGNKIFIEPNEVVDRDQTLFGMLSYPASIMVKAGEKAQVKVNITVSPSARFGDYYGIIYFSESKDVAETTSTSSSGVSASVGVSARLGSIIVLKVLGGDEDINEFATVSGYKADSQANARNTVNFSFDLMNSGNSFFEVISNIGIYEKKTDLEPIKSLKKEVLSLGNVKKRVILPLGDLGDDYPEKQYYAKLQVYSKDDPKNVFAEQWLGFQYYVPVSIHGVPEVIEKEVEVYVETPFVEVVKELILYVTLFLIVLIVFVRVLFSSMKGVKK